MFIDSLSDSIYSKSEQATFLSKVGVCQWITQGVSPTTKFTVQRIAQHMASPNVGALKAFNDLLRYHKVVTWMLASPLIDPNPPVGSARYGLYVDADNSSNPEINNKRKAMYGFVFGYVQGRQKRCIKVSTIQSHHSKFTYRI